MKDTSLPMRESQRLAELLQDEVMDTPLAQAYEDLLSVASAICGTPVAMVSIVDEQRQWIKASGSGEVTQTPRSAAFCAHSLQTPQESLVIPDTLRDERFRDNAMVTGPPYVRFYASAPLLASADRALGTLCVMDTEPHELEPFQHEALAAVSRQTMALLALRTAYKELRHHLSEREWYERQIDEHQQQLKSENAQLVEQSLTDPLTGLPNRRAFNIRMELAFAECSSQHTPLALAIVDIDHFKAINDRHGHPAGDEALGHIARALRAQCGTRFSTTRFGGDEFAVLISNTPLRDAQAFCEEMRRAIEALDHGVPLTVSIGVAAMHTADTVGDLYARADEALYAAKRAGRNQVAGLT